MLGSGLLMPFFGFSNNQEELPTPPSEDEEYQTLLKPDGSAVKVKVSTHIIDYLKQQRTEQVLHAMINQRQHHRKIWNIVRNLQLRLTNVLN